MRTLSRCLLYKLIPRPDGKTDKLPFCPTDVIPCGNDSESRWRSYDECSARAMALGTEYGVAAVIHPDDKLFFIDIDDCNLGGEWSPLALEIMSMFAGCYIEVSQSGQGLHIIGSYTGDEPTHKCKDTKLGLELYTWGRFCALTGMSAVGNIRHVADASLVDFIDRYMPSTGDAIDNPITDNMWRDTPVDDWNGIEDDMKLVEVACRAVGSAMNVFAGKASFKDLYFADELKLAANYPSQNGRDKWDKSSADYALANHLAFWTGKNHSRMERILRGSKLYRDKWDKHPNYLRDTILKAVVNCKEVFASREVQPVIEANTDPTVVNTLPITDRGVSSYITVEQQKLIFKDCAYIIALNQIITPDGLLLGREQFDAVYGGFKYQFDALGEKDQASAWKVFTQSQAVQFPQAYMTCFRPELKPLEIVESCGLTLINSYVPIETPSVEGDVSLFLEHLANLLPDANDREILLSYMAACVQHIGNKFTWCPIIQGCEGNGKSLLISIMVKAIGERYSHLPNVKDLDNKFNAWIMNKLFVGVEEIYVSERREITEALKTLITNSSIEVQKKGKDQVTTDNRANFIMCTNHKDGLPVTVDGRRYAIFYTAQQSADDLVKMGMTERYFRKLWNWLNNGGYANVTHYLQNYVIAEDYNPAVLSLRAPATTSTVEAVMINRGFVEQTVMQAISDEEAGFTGGYISSLMLRELCEKLRIKMSPHKMKVLIDTLGYVRHPNLPEGKIHKTIVNEGGRPIIYINRRNTLLFQMNNRDAILADYCKKQGYVGATLGEVRGNE